MKKVENKTSPSDAKKPKKTRQGESKNTKTKKPYRGQGTKRRR